MTNRSLQYLLKLGAVTSAAVLALSTHAYLQDRDDNGKGRHEQDRDDQGQGRHEEDRDDNGHERHEAIALATGQFVTPTIIKDAVQQYLNPGLPAYPDFIAGEAVRSQLSPDGTTLAIITAGQNSLYKTDGTVDVANSTQFVFLYNVEGVNQAKPVLMKVFQQRNAHDRLCVVGPRP